MKKQKNLQKKGISDHYCIWITTILLVAFGLVMVFSASCLEYIASERYGNDAMYLFKRQFIFAMLGFAVCLIAQFLDYRMLFPFSKVIYFIGIVCIALLSTSMGVNVNGATRWLNIAGIQFQVAELVKICVIVGLAYMVSYCSKRFAKLPLIALMWGVGGGAAVLLLFISNDLSSSVVILGITFGITFIYNGYEKLHYGVAGLAVAAVAGYVWSIARDLPTPAELEQMSFRVGRIAAWICPEKYASDQGYQTLQALYAIGRGGLFGKGLGSSLQKIEAIPEAQNDMIFSIICEELGLVGAGMLLFLFIYLVWNLYRVSISAKSVYGSVISTGVMLHIAIQVVMNIGVNLNLLPNTGIGLPFISYGGTAVCFQLLEIALVLSVSRSANGFQVFHIKDLFRKKRRK